MMKFKVSKSRKITIVLVLAILLNLFGTGLAMADNPSSELRSRSNSSISKALGYFHNVQNTDGGFPSRVGGASSRTVSEWVIISLTAAGEDLKSSSWAPAGTGPLDYLQTSQAVLESTTDYARTLLALSAANLGKQKKGLDLTEKLASFQQESGQFGQPGEEGQINAHMWSVLALKSVDREIPDCEKAREWLLARQNPDGGFAWVEGVDSDADDTAVAVQVLVTLGEDSEKSSSIQKALTYLKSCQVDSGGFRSGWAGDSSNLNSDAWVLQGLVAAGENPFDNKWIMHTKSVWDDMIGLQNCDGSFNWMIDTLSCPVTNTAYAVIALTEKSFPITFKNSTSCLNGDEKVIAKPAFSDLNSSHWAYDSIMKLVQTGVLGGYPDGSFKAEQKVSRAEFTKFLVSGLGLEDALITNARSFPDVPPQHWAFKYVAIASSEGYISGRPDGSFDPNGEIKGSEMAAILVRFLAPENMPSIKPGAQWFAPYVEKARKMNILYPGFESLQSANRAQCADSIVRVKDRK